MGGGKRFPSSFPTYNGAFCDVMGRLKIDVSSVQFVSKHKPNVVQLLIAIKSLYRDQLKPYGRIVRKRLTENSSTAGFKVDADLTRLREFCGKCPSIQVESECGGEWSALLVGEPCNFVDVYSPQDVYPEGLWDALATYCAALEGEAARLPGGRYACAQTLMSRKLPWLENYSLGEVCHIVQLAISQKKLLGYLDGGIAPYAASRSKAKDQAAAWQTACGNVVDDVQHASWDKVHVQLQLILQESVGPVALSNIKRIFKCKFEEELSETALGHSKLSELLHDSRFHDICYVKLLEQGYFVIPTRPFSIEPEVRHTFLHFPPKLNLRKRSLSAPVNVRVECVDGSPRTRAFTIDGCLHN